MVVAAERESTVGALMKQKKGHRSTAKTNSKKAFQAELIIRLTINYFTKYS
jgi:hypothetical protein